MQPATKAVEISEQRAFCCDCRCQHSIPRLPAADAARELMKSMDLELATDSLYGEARGKMFGVLVCRSETGETVILRAFSGQYNGEWQVRGWVPPLFDVEAFHRLNTPVEREIKALGRRADGFTRGSEQHKTLLAQRKRMSQQLMRDIHALYSLHNFRGEERSLGHFFPSDRGIPTGAGDCCAPKLLNHAAIKKLTPLGLIEFFHGKTNRSATRHEGEFYPACEEKCAPLLGFLLCGINELETPCRS